MATYDPKSLDAGAFINHEEILETLAQARAQAADPLLVRTLLVKAAG